MSSLHKTSATPGLVVVTGCSTGIGRALALAFLQGGYPVLATARRMDTLVELAGAGALVRELDVCDGASIGDLAEWLARGNHRVAMVVNNAGYGAMGPAAGLGMEALKRQMDTNVVGPLALVGALLGRMDPGSLVVNIGSVSGVFVTPWAGAYCASKAALHMLGEALEMELAPLGIRVMSVRPGAIKSAFGDTAARGLGDLVPDDSPFAPWREGIAARAQESQGRAATAEALAARVVQACGKKKPPRVLYFGPKSLQLRIMKALIPPGLLRNILSRRYGLA